MRIVNSLDDLLRLPRDRYVNGFSARMAVRLEIPKVSRHSLIKAQRMLNRLQSRCGCVAGAIALLATLAVGASYVYAQNAETLSWRVLPQAGAVLLAAFVTGFAAKVATLAATRWQFACACRAQHRALSCLIQQPDR